MVSRVVDYSPLLATPTPDEVKAYRTEARAAGHPWARTTGAAIILTVFVVLFAVVVLGPMIGGVTAFVFSDSAGSPVGIALLAFFLITFGIVAFALLRAAFGMGSQWARWLRLDRFARANGFVFSPSSPNPAYPGAIFSIGSSRTAVEHLRTADGRFLDFGNYRYTTGSGKNRRTHTWGFLAIQLDRRLPHMVLDAKANNGLLGGTNLPATFDKNQILSLEGDFDEHFTLYCPVQYERDALYVFTPDLMALLIDHAAPFDVEIVDDWMFVYSAKPFPSGNPAAYQRLLRIVETVGAKTLTQTDRYRDERAAVPFAANIVAPEGTRLKRSIGVGAVILIILSAIIWIWSFVSDIMVGFGS